MGFQIERLEDLDEVKNRMASWWEHEKTDRPVISYSYPNTGKVFYADGWYLAQNFDNVKEYLEFNEKEYSSLICGGEKIQRIFPNFGPGIMASVLGIKPEYIKGTMWFEKITDITDILTELESVKLNDNNEWYSRLKRIIEYAASTAKDKGYSVGMTDLGGVLDILSSFLGPQKLIVNMKRNPGIIDSCRAVILEKTIKVYNELQAIIDNYNLGSNAWLNVWCPKHYYPIQCDFSAMLSPKWFKRFVLPDLIEQAADLDYAIYHLDGPNELPYIDDLLAAPEITGIQWVPGTNQPKNADDVWMPLYHKIQKAGKNIVTSCGAEDVPKLYRELDPVGLFVSTNFGAKIFADYYLPTFMGGMNGIDPEEEDD
jgi:hypothetical protein